MTSANQRQQLTDTQKTELREYFINHDLSLQELSDASEQLCGTKVSLSLLKKISANDPLGKWGVLKANNGRRTSDVPNEEKIAVVADKLYEFIVDEEDPLPGTAVAQVAKTWYDLIQKANLSKVTASARTSSQRVKDLIAGIEATTDG